MQACLLVLVVHVKVKEINMKYIVYKQPNDSTYPWEITSNLFSADGYVLASISSASADVFDWVRWDAVEVSSELATSSLWGDCSIKNGQTDRYRKWVPEDLDMVKPTLSSYVSGSTGDDTGVLRYIITEADDIAGGEWNKFIINRVIKTVFDNRFTALGIVDGELEKATYQAQLTEAVNYAIDNTADTPLLDALASGRDIAVNQLAADIISANDIYNGKVVSLLSQQKLIQDRIKAAVGIDETLLLKEDLLGVMVDSGLAITSGRADDDNRTVSDTTYGIQF